MALSFQAAMEHVQKCTRRHKLQFRDYAVSDFAQYSDYARRWSPGRDFRKAWALYEKWGELCRSGNRKWTSANGKPFDGDQRTRTFRFRPCGNTLAAPTLFPDRPQGLPPGTERVVLKGVGQCEYFATKAFNALSRNGKPNTVPRIDKISTPGHNWVLVNADAASTNDWIAVDYWMYALGAPEARCIRRYRGFEFDRAPIAYIRSFGPY